MVRLNTSSAEQSPGIDLGQASEVVAFHSKTSPGTFHFTIVLATPAIFKRYGGEVQVLCTCKGFQNHRKCWHIAAVAGQDSDESGE